MAQPAPTHLFPHGVQGHAWGVPPRKRPGKGHSDTARAAVSSRPSIGSRAHVTRGSREWGTSQGEHCLGDFFVSWGGGHLRSRNTRDDEEEADIPGESTSVRKGSGVQGCNTSQMRLGKVL